MNIELEDGRSLEVNSLRGEIEIWLYDSLTRTRKLIGRHRGGKYVESHPELFEIGSRKNGGYGKMIIKAIKECYETPEAEFTKKLTCLRRSILLKVLLIRRKMPH